MLKLKQNKGITLIALIITIIVMLILVAVTVTVALNGGLFGKAEEAGIKTKISQVQDALIVKKTEKMAEKQGVVKEYDLEIIDLDLPTELKNEFSGKLIIGTDGNLYYDSTVVTDAKEQNRFKEMGIQPYVEIPTRVPFTNYIERGNNYYIKGDKTSSSYEVATFSESGTFTIYEVNNGQVSERNSFSNISFEIIDKSKIESELGCEVEVVEQAAGITIDEINDDVITWGMEGIDMKAANVFKSNYTQVIITVDWYTLDTTYQFPS